MTSEQIMTVLHDIRDASRLIKVRLDELYAAFPSGELLDDAHEMICDLMSDEMHGNTERLRGLKLRAKPAQAVQAVAQPVQAAAQVARPLVDYASESSDTEDSTSSASDSSSYSDSDSDSDFPRKKRARDSRDDDAPARKRSKNPRRVAGRISHESQLSEIKYNPDEPDADLRFKPLLENTRTHHGLVNSLNITSTSLRETNPVQSQRMHIDQLRLSEYRKLHGIHGPKRVLIVRKK